jgi:hypothetical protein
MLRHILDGHALGQLQDVSLEGVGVPAPLVGEVDGHLTDLATIGTAHPRHLQHDLDGTGANGETAKTTYLKPPPNHPPRAARGTAKISSFLTDREDHLAAFIRGLDIMVAANPKPMIQ